MRLDTGNSGRISLHESFPVNFTKVATSTFRGNVPLAETGWHADSTLGPYHQPSEQDRIAFFSSLINTGACQNPATCGANKGD